MLEQHINTFLSLLSPDLLSYSSEAIFIPIQTEFSKRVVATQWAFYQNGCELCLFERREGKAKCWGKNFQISIQVLPFFILIWPQSREKQEGKKTCYSQRSCKLWLPTAHGFLKDTSLVPLHPPQDVPAFRGRPAEAQPSPAGASPLQKGDWEPAALLGW